MSNPIIRIHDLSTNEVIDREMTNEEIAAKLSDPLEIEAQRQRQAELDEAETKAAEKAALLAKLGITEDEAKLLLS